MVQNLDDLGDISAVSIRIEKVWKLDMRKIVKMFRNLDENFKLA